MEFSSIRRWSLPSWSIPVEFSSIWRWSLSLLVYTRGILLHQEMVTPLLVYTRGILLHLEMVTPLLVYTCGAAPPSGGGHSPSWSIPVGLLLHQEMVTLPPGLYPWDSPPSGDGHSPSWSIRVGFSSIRRWSLPCWSIPVGFSSLRRWSLSLLVYTHGILLPQKMVTPPPGLHPWGCSSIRRWSLSLSVAQSKNNLSGKLCGIFFKELKLELAFDPAIPLLGIHPKKRKSLYQKDRICMWMFIAAPFTIAKMGS